MPSRLRQTPARNDETTKLYNIPGLRFNEPLTWRAGKAISVADLLSRLQKLGTELRSLDQDEVQSRDFTALANDLANNNLLGHKDKGIRAWTISCVVDVLKLCAPDAPFNEGQLKDIFTVIITWILPTLADPSHAYNSEHIYILHSLANSESIVLLTDIPNNESLISTLFATCFDVASGSGKAASDQEVSTSVEYHLKILLCAVINELTLPQDVTDIIISQFLRVDARSQPDQNGKSRKSENPDNKQSNLLLKDYPRAYNMAKSICTTCSEKMTAQITQYFGTIIMDASSALQNQEDLKQSRKHIPDPNNTDDEDESLADLRKAHRLLRELWRACPDLLLNVIPQVEAELSADSISLRQLATETLGDIAAGVGIAGLAPSVPLDPTVYPLPTINNVEITSPSVNPLLTAASPKPFLMIHSSAYQSFLGRKNDKSSSVRATWAAAVGRILVTSAGGIGMNESEKSELLLGFAQMLRDSEERVRVSAVRAIGLFTYHDILGILCANGGASMTGTVLSTLCERVTDRKIHVREEAIELLGRIWGTASGDIEERNEIVVAMIGDIPKRLLGAYFTNDLQIHSLLDKALFESLIPISFPPIKAQTPQTDGQKQRERNKQNDIQEPAILDPDGIRVRRILTLIHSLDSRTRQVFFGMQKRQVQLAKGVTAFLKACEDFNGGVVDDDAEEDKIKNRLTLYIETLSKTFPDRPKVAADLWKFAKLHNRRDYQLIRFAMGSEHDYRTMTKAMKELTKRIREGPTNTQSLIETLMPLLYRSALILYNRSHVPAIMEISRTDEGGLAEAAHEVLKEISTWNPEVLKSHIQALCKELEDGAPSATRFEEPGAADTLKACSAFARQYPAEVTKERKFLVAMTNFALYSKSYRAAKHAVSIVLTVADRKEFYAKEILSKSLKDCKQSSPNFLSRLATIAQLCLLAPATTHAEADAILRIALEETLYINASPSAETDTSAWDATPDDEIIAKELALKILVNRCRSENEKENKEEFEKSASQVFEILMLLINEDGEVTPTKDTPASQRNHLRLAAAKLILKLCSHKRRCEELVTPHMFISLAMLVINPPNAVRSGFISQVKKYLGQSRLNHRWFTVLFLVAFEPDFELKNSTLNWLRSREQFFSRQRQQAKATDRKSSQNVLESVFVRMLSLLAHHPDYPDKDTEYYNDELTDFSKYVIFYLVAVATEDNISLVFHFAQRLKQTKDGIDGSEAMSERLYVLSDLAQATIRNYADLMPAHAKGMNLLQTWPGNVTLPRSLFSSLPNHSIAQEIVEKNYLPEDVASDLEKVIKSYVKSLKGSSQSSRKTTTHEKKRKTDTTEFDEDIDEDDAKQSVKKSKKKTLPIRRTPQQKRKSIDIESSELPSRKSARVSNTNAVSYLEVDSDEAEAAIPASITKVGTSKNRVDISSTETAKTFLDHQDDENGFDETNDVADQNGHTKENEGEAEGLDESENENENPSDLDQSPSPLKEKSNPGPKRGKGKAKAKTSVKSPKTAMTTKKEKATESTGRPTRQTRSMK